MPTSLKGAPGRAAIRVIEDAPELMRLRACGFGFEHIADTLGYRSAKAAEKTYNAVLDALPTLSNMKHLRMLQNEKLNLLLQSYLPRALGVSREEAIEGEGNPETAFGDPIAAALVLKVVDQQSRLMGLYDPQELDDSETGGVVTLFTKKATAVKRMALLAAAEEAVEDEEPDFEDGGLVDLSEVFPDEVL